MTDRQSDAQKSHGTPVEPWAVHAARWEKLGPPLRPYAEDLQRLRVAWLAARLGGISGRRVDVLALGVTPEVALFPWAEKVSLRAIDSSADMIRTVWPGDAPERKAVLGNWLQTPFADGAFDLIVCDAGLAQLVGMESLTVLGRELRRLLRADGRAVMRHFARPVRSESEQSIVAATEAGLVANFHELKLRLLMALEAATPQLGVRLGDVWDCFTRLFPNRDLLAQRLGCDAQTVATIDAYRGRDARYSFLPLGEVAQAFASFRLALGPAGHYPLAECCPVFSLTPIP